VWVEPDRLLSRAADHSPRQGFVTLRAQSMCG